MHFSRSPERWGCSSSGSITDAPASLDFRSRAGFHIRNLPVCCYSHALPFAPKASEWGAGAVWVLRVSPVELMKHLAPWGRWMLPHVHRWISRRRMGCLKLHTDGKRKKNKTQAMALCAFEPSDQFQLDLTTVLKSIKCLQMSGNGCWGAERRPTGRYPKVQKGLFCTSQSCEL